MGELITSIFMGCLGVVALFGIFVVFCGTVVFALWTLFCRLVTEAEEDVGEVFADEDLTTIEEGQTS